MLTLYYSPGACSLASHIALEETGEPYEAKLTSLAADAQKSAAYLKVNPRGKVPALSVDGEVITENTAILSYIGKRFQKANLWPTDPVKEAQCIGQMAWFSNVVHVSQRALMRPYRYIDDEGMYDAVKRTGKANYHDNVREIDALLEGKTWMMGEQYTVCDPYALVFYGWGLRTGLPMHELRAFTAFKDRMFERPAVRAVIESEQDPNLKLAA